MIRIESLLGPRELAEVSSTSDVLLTAAVGRASRAFALGSVDGRLWAQLCAGGLIEADELIHELASDRLVEALAWVVPCLPRALVTRACACSGPDTPLLFEGVLRLLELDALDDALALTHRLNRAETLVQLLPRIPESRRAPLPERALSDAQRGSNASRVEALCGLVRFVDEAQRGPLLATCAESISRLAPAQVDAGQNPWEWLALAHLELHRIDEARRCIDRAFAEVAAGRFDALSDVDAALRAAARLEPGHWFRLELAERALTSLERVPHHAAEFLARVVGLAPSLAPRANAIVLPMEDEVDEVSQPTPETRLDPLEELRATIEEARTHWSQRRTAPALRELLQPHQPAAASPPQQFPDEARARVDFTRWKGALVPTASGWLKNTQGEHLDFETQLRMRPALSLDEVEGLLAHLDPTRARRTDLLYLVEHAARLQARAGDVEAMRAHLDDLAAFTTTPARQFECARELPAPLGERELLRVVEAALPLEPRPLEDCWPLRGLLFETRFAPVSQRLIALQGVERLAPGALKLECLGTFLDTPDEARRRALLALAPLTAALTPDDAVKLPVSDAMAAVLCTLETSRALACWVALVNLDPPVLSWRLALHVLGRDALARLC